ncbi:MAG TPA: hypothetical protein VFH47_05900, partial [Candidatus Thermoplasmatota archaeon]|nr:hypothetical protein [Candidatus Thermoplasmatota archaeon]
MPLDGFWTQYGDAIELFAIYTAGIVIYTLLSAACYTFLSRRSMFGERNRTDAVRGLAVGMGYISIFPLVSFAFFLLLAASFLFFFNAEADANLTTERIFTISMAIVAAVRLAAYVHEDTAHELAKLIPLGLLGIFLVFNDVTTLKESFLALRAILDEIDVVGVFFAIVVLLEFLLRALYLAGRAAGRASRRPRP